MNDSEKAKLYIDFELRWNKRLGWILSRALIFAGIISVIIFLIFPSYGEKIIFGLIGAVVFFLCIHLVLFMRERRLKKFIFTSHCR
jgi:Flp pilus assembly protein TadB